MTRDEAQITAGAECKEFRPLSLGTMAILQQLHNATLAALLGGGGLAVDYEDFIVFLYVHARANSLGQIKQYMLDGSLVQRAYDWVEQADPLTIAAGVSYFTDTQERAALVAAGNAKESTEKKRGKPRTPNPLARLDSSLSPL